jgi:FHS family glucose/mannose:H+ symporter-like MFS transporter
MLPSKLVKVTVYYQSAFLQGVCLILVPAASFIFKSPARHGLTDQQYGMLFLPMISGAILATVFFKKILTQLREEKLFYLGFLSNIFYLGILFMAEHASRGREAAFFLLLAANLFLGLGFGLLVSVLNLLVVELFPRKRDSIVTGLHAFLGIGASVAPLLANFFYSRNFWTGGLLLSLAVVCFFALVSFLLRAAQVPVESRPKGHEKVRNRSYRTHLPGGILLFLLTIFFYGIAESIIGNWSTVYLMEEKAFSVQTVSLALSTFWLFMTLGRLIATLVVIKFDPRYLYRFSPFLVMLSLAAIILTCAESRILFFYVAVGIGCSYFFPFSISLSTQYFDAWRERLSSLAIAALMLGVGIGSSMTGLLYNSGLIHLSHAFMTAVGCSALIAWTAYWLTRRRPFEVRI